MTFQLQQEYEREQEEAYERYMEEYERELDEACAMYMKEQSTKGGLNEHIRN
jgi:hypothetical protein